MYRARHSWRQSQPIDHRATRPPDHRHEVGRSGSAGRHEWGPLQGTTLRGDLSAQINTIRAEISTLILRSRCRTLRLGKRVVFQWSRLKPDTSAPAHEAESGDVLCCISLPFPAPLPNSPVYTDDTLAPIARLCSLQDPLTAELPPITGGGAGAGAVRVNRRVYGGGGQKKV